MAPSKSIGSLSAMAKNIKEKVAKPSTMLPGAAAFRSAERVEDSDTSSSDSSSDSDSDSGSDSDEGLEAARKKLEAKNAAKKAATTKPQTNGKPAAASAKKVTADSSSEDSSSDSDSDSESDTKNSKPAPKPATKPAKKDEPALKPSSDEDSSSESESESDSGSEAGGKLASITDIVAEKAKKTNAAIPSKKPTAAEKASSDSESESESEDESMAVVRTDTVSQAVDVTRPEWLNKSDFMLRKAATDNPGKEVSEFLSKSNLEGKQVWYFTAPASLPITVIKDMEIDLTKAQSGGAILNHGGDAYGLDLEPYTTSSQIQLLIPSKGGEKYNSLSRPIDSVVHLRRIAEFGGTSKISSTATDQYVRQKRPPREQPKNLKARFTPIGVPTVKPSAVPAQKTQLSKRKLTTESDSDSSSSDSDVEMTDAAALPSSALNQTPNTGAKRKQSANTSSSESDSSSSESEDEAPPKKKAKSPAKTKKQSQKDFAKPKANPPAPAVQSENIAVPGSQVSKKTQGGLSTATPVPPPSIGRSASSLSAANETPSKPVGSAKSKAKKADKGKASGSTPNAISSTPIPPPTYGLGK